MTPAKRKGPKGQASWRKGSMAVLGSAGEACGGRADMSDKVREKTDGTGFQKDMGILKMSQT